MVGLAVGAMAGGVLIGYGRRLCYLCSCILAIVGICLTLVQNFGVMVFGRVVFGFAVGIMTCNIPKFVEETIPSHVYGTFGSIYPLSTTFGAFAATLFGLALPPDTDLVALRENQTWRYVYGFPILLCIIQILILLFVIKHDSPKFLIF